MLNKIGEYSYYTSAECVMCSEPIQNHKLLGLRLNRSHGFNPHKKKGMAVSILRCSKCGLIYADPLPIPTNIQDHYNVPPEDYWEESYFDIPANYFKYNIRQAKKYLNKDKDISALEVGAGIGKSLKVMLAEGWDAYAIEPSIEFRKQAIKRMNISPERIQLSMVEDAQFGANQFDFINIQNVLEHLYDPGEVMKKLIYWTKPNGIIALGIPCSDWLTGTLINQFNKLRGKNYVTNLSPLHPPYHLYEFSIRSFIENGKLLNYSVEEHSYWTAPSFLPKFLDKLYIQYLHKSDKGMILSVILRKNAS